MGLSVSSSVLSSALPLCASFGIAVVGIVVGTVVGTAVAVAGGGWVLCGLLFL